MKQIFLVFLSVLTFSAIAQIKTPSASPFSKVEQTIGITDFTVEYSRPSVKERAIFAADGLVPYGEIWRTGANAVTKFSTSNDIMVEGSKLAAGDYAILTLPAADKWMVHFYPYEKSSWSSYTEATPTAAVSVKPMKTNMDHESFLIFFDNLTDNSGHLKMAWENTVVPVMIKLTDEENIMASIEKALAGPTGNDYYAAASYYHSAGKDLSLALGFIDKATAGDNPKFWQVRRKALILADMGRTKDAIAAAKQSMELAKTAGNMDYVRMNEKSIKEWTK